MSIKSLFKNFIIGEFGHGVTEYGILLVFGTVLIGLVTQLLSSNFSMSVSSSFPMLGTALHPN